MAADTGEDLEQVTGPEAGAEGILADVKGQAKEVAGEIANREDLVEEVQAQQDKARAERDVRTMKPKQSEPVPNPRHTKRSNGATPETLIG